jgi:hypothetical protein
MTTALAIHAFARIRHGVSTPVWRSDAWLAPPASRHLHLVAPPATAQLSLFGEAA